MDHLRKAAAAAVDAGPELAAAARILGDADEGRHVRVAGQRQRPADQPGEPARAAGRPGSSGIRRPRRHRRRCAQPATRLPKRARVASGSAAQAASPIRVRKRRSPISGRGRPRAAGKRDHIGSRPSASAIASLFSISELREISLQIKSSAAPAPSCRAEAQEIRRPSRPSASAP